MKDKTNWVLSDIYMTYSKIPIPNKIGEWTILGFWIDENKYIKAVKAQCSCGTINEYINANSLKTGRSTKCRKCVNPTRIWFIEKYGKLFGENIYKLYRKRYEQSTSIEFPNGIPFEERWKIDYKAFAEYIVNLPNFDKWPKYQMDRMDNSQGYLEGNIRFVSRQENLNNKGNTRFIEFNGIKYPMADFVRLVSNKFCNTIYNFISRRTYNKNMSISQILKELRYSNCSKLWPSKEIRDYFLTWYATNISE